MESTGDKLEKEIHFWPEKESFRHFSNDNSEVHAKPLSVKALLAMAGIDIFCVYNSGFWKLMTTPVYVAQ